MATKEEIQQLLDAIKGALSAKFDENDKRFTTLINGLQTQFSAQESRFSTLEQVVQQMVNPAVSSTHPQVLPRTVPISENREKRSRGFQLSLEKYDGKPRSDLNTWIAQVEEKCSLQYIPDDEVGRWAKVHLEGNALAFIFETWNK